MHSFFEAFAFRGIPVLALSLASLPVIAQPGPAPAPPPPPSISTSAVGETTVVPDRAMLSVAVESQGQTAAAAGAENAKLQARVIDAVKAAGVAAAQIRTVGYNVFPEYTQPTGGKGPRISGYRAHNTVQIEVRSLETVGKVIDAVLAAGATNLGGLSLFASNTDAARREALQKPVAKARSDAEALAAAAGGSLGPVLEMTTEPFGVPQPIVRQAMAMEGRAAVSTPVETGEMTVQAVVHVRWQFVPGR
jgi:uncharacterized protein YggE